MIKRKKIKRRMNQNQKVKIRIKRTENKYLFCPFNNFIVLIKSIKIKILYKIYLFRN